MLFPISADGTPTMTDANAIGMARDDTHEAAAGSQLWIDPAERGTGARFDRGRRAVARRQLSDWPRWRTGTVPTIRSRSGLISAGDRPAVPGWSGFCSAHVPRRRISSCPISASLPALPQVTPRYTTPANPARKRVASVYEKRASDLRFRRSEALWRVKDSNLRSFRDGFTVDGDWGPDLGKRPAGLDFDAHSARTLGPPR